PSGSSGPDIVGPVGCVPGRPSPILGSLMTGELFDAATALLPDVIDLRRRLHRIPEVGLELPRTQAAVIEALDGLGLRLTTGHGLSSVVGVLEGPAPGPTVLLRADMDALPVRERTGLPFASGHDG